MLEYLQICLNNAMDVLFIFPIMMVIGIIFAMKIV